MTSLQGKRALITGGTQGVGQAIALALAGAGADCLLVGLADDQFAQQTVQACRQQGVQCELICCDLAREPEQYLDQLMQQVDGTLPGVDLLVNNAGTYIDRPFLEMDYQRFQKTFHLNVTAGFFLTQRVAQRWVAQGIHGRIVFTGSINGLLSEPDHVAYDASKGAVAAMVRSLCVSLAPHGIRVNSMAPGLVRTPLTSSAIDADGFDQWMRLHTPNGEVPDANVCGEVATFLLSDAAQHIHGQTLYVDGGMSVWQQPDPPAGWSPS